MVRLPRTVAKLVALFGGYFWLPCPCCARMFAGFETYRGDHLNTMPANRQAIRGTALCPPCARKGVGCHLWADKDGDRMYSTACRCPMPDDHDQPNDPDGETR